MAIALYDFASPNGIEWAAEEFYIRGVSAVEVISGYLGWEIMPGTSTRHPDARLLLNSGRSCLQALLQCEKPSAVWVPYYCCDALLEPFCATETPIHFYALNTHLGVADPLPELEPDQRLVYTNYFGVAGDEIQRLSRHYGCRLWVDNAQAFFARPQPEDVISFNSARKFFGVPDGAYLYAPQALAIGPPNVWQRNTDYRFEHLFLRTLSRVGEGYEIYLDNEKRIGGDIRRISELGETLLSLIDYSAVARKRRKNFTYLHARIGERNRFSASRLMLADDIVPLCYPFLPERSLAHRYFWDRDIFIPRFWEDCLRRDATDVYRFERELSMALLPLPVDQHCTISMLDQVIAAVKKAEKTRHG